MLVQSLFILAAFSYPALAQSSESVFTIQTSPPTPVSSSGIASSTGSTNATGSATSSSAEPTGTSPSVFPTVCDDECSSISQVLSTCGAGIQLNTTCLCTTQVQQSYLQCVECAISLNPDANLLPSYQALLNAYATQCRVAGSNPVTLPNVTVTLPSTSGLSSSSLSSSMNITSSAIPTSAPSSSIAPSSTAASAAASAASSTGAANLSALPLQGLWTVGAGVAGIALGVVVML